MKARLSREEAIELVGKALVDQLDSIDAEPTSRAYPHEEGEIEWVASIDINIDALPREQKYKIPNDASLRVYYYTSAADEERVIDTFGGDWGMLNWDYDHYEIW